MVNNDRDSVNQYKLGTYGALISGALSIIL